MAEKLLGAVADGNVLPDLVNSTVFCLADSFVKDLMPDLVRDT